MDCHDSLSATFIDIFLYYNYFIFLTLF